MAKYYSVINYGGLTKNNQLLLPIGQVPNPPMNRVENFRGMIDLASVALTTPPVGMITKSPKVANFKATMPAAGRGRGLWQYLPYIADIATTNFLIAYQQTTDYTVSKLYKLDLVANTWTTLYTGGTVTYFPADADIYNSRIYFLLDSNFLKLNSTWATAPTVKDKSGTATAIAGAVLTWNATTTVTSDIDISALISIGDWIRRSSTSEYWDEVKSIAVGGLSMTLSAASFDTGASSAGGGQKAPVPTWLSTPPWFMRFWKEKLWICGNDDTLRWSVTGDPENYDVIAGGGSLDLSSFNQEGVSGIEFLDDNLFIFFDLHYEIWNWSGELDEPITKQRSVPYGCLSRRTIQKNELGIFYLSSTGLRLANSSEDVLISEEINSYVKTSLATTRHYYYFLSGAGANTYPWAIIDNYRGFYSLHIPASTGNTLVINVDYNQKGIAGIDNYYDAGHGTLVYTDANSKPTLAFSKMTASNQLTSFNAIGTDVSTAGTLESCTFYSGNPNKKLKIYYVEFDFHPVKSGNIVNTNIVFNYRKDFEAVDTANDQTLSFRYNSTPTGVEKTLDRVYIKDTNRFNLGGLLCQYFSWQLTSTDTGSGTDDISMISWSCSYDLVDTI